MSDTDNQQPQDAADALAEDHSQVDKLIQKLLVTLDQKNQAQAFELLDLLWTRLAVHIRAEHLCVFPSILDAATVNFTGGSGTPKYDEAKRALDLLRHDHDFFMRELGTAVNTMRKQKTRFDHDVISKQLQDVRRSVVRVRSRLDTHNQLEENHVYKWIDVLLDEAERSALTARIRYEIEKIPPRFSSGTL